MLEGVFYKWAGYSTENRLLTIVRVNGDGSHEKVTITRKEANEIVSVLQDEEYRIKGLSVSQ